MLGRIVHPARAHVGDRIHHQLVRERRAAPVAGHLRDHRGQVPAGAVPGDGEPGRVDPELVGVAGDPAGRGVGVLGAGRPPVLRCQPVVDRHDDGVDGIGETSAAPVVTVQITDHPSAPVEVHDPRPARGVAARAVHADRDLAVGTRDHPVLDAPDRLDVRGRGHRLRQLTGLRGGRDRVDRRERLLQHLDERRGSRIDRHCRRTLLALLTGRQNHR